MTQHLFLVIPELAKPECNAFGSAASSGIHLKEIPAFAGMTMDKVTH